jgi:hypothetical protein
MPDESATGHNNAIKLFKNARIVWRYYEARRLRPIQEIVFKEIARFLIAHA